MEFTEVHGKDAKKRNREGPMRSHDDGNGIEEDGDDGDDKKNRGNYRCSRCNLPKKGHICPFQARYRRRDPESGGAPGSAASQLSLVEASVQVELDINMTLRAMGHEMLQKQGLPESYIPVKN